MKEPAIPKKKSSRKSCNCYNCGRLMRKPRLYCTELCKQEAKAVRYARGCKKDGRIRRADIKDAIQIRLAHILSGGYSTKKRYLSPIVRAKVISRDNGLCQQCGNPGNEIDHINGHSSNLKNLQLLCRDCHIKKTKSHLKELTPETPGFEEKNQKIIEIMNRIESKVPLKICDDDENWEKIWRGLYLKRKKQAA
jgi:5-methylcytosine-specific restriction endonuclease McrA